MRRVNLVNFGIASTIACIVIGISITRRSNDRSVMDIHENSTRNRSSVRQTDQNRESIFQKRIRSRAVEFKNLDEKMDFIDEMIGEDTFPQDKIASIAKFQSDLDFILSLEWSHQQISCLINLSKNFARDSLASAKDPMDYLARISMLSELIHEHDDKVDCEQLMQAVAIQTKKALLGLPHDTAKNYKELMSSTLSEGGDQAEISSRILGEMISMSLKMEPFTTKTKLLEIKDPLLRLGTEKALLRDANIDTTTKQIYAAYYLSDDCLLPHDIATEKNLFGLGIKFDPETISFIIGDAPLGTKRDYAIEHLVYRSASDDPERAELWLESITDPKVKARAKSYLLKKNNN